MQPYFLPYLTYFSLVEACDVFVFFDTAQYVRRSWMNRNRILNPGAGWSYLGVPVRYSPVLTPVRNKQIDTSTPWHRDLLASVGRYRRRAPHYARVVGLLDTAEIRSAVSICQLNILLIKRICEDLGLTCRFVAYSELDPWAEERQAPVDWVWEGCALAGANSYLNLPGGVELYDAAEYTRRGLPFHFIENGLRPYPQGEERFVPGLSIIDVMMFNEREEVLEQIRNYRLFVPGESEAQSDA